MLCHGFYALSKALTGWVFIFVEHTMEVQMENNMDCVRGIENKQQKIIPSIVFICGVVVYVHKQSPQVRYYTPKQNHFTTLNGWFEIGLFSNAFLNLGTLD